VEGDLKGAIDLYKRVAGGAANRAQVAKALLGLGECYEKQGDAEARKAYERLVKEFGDQAEQAREAQARLAAMGKTAGGDGVVAQSITRGSDIDLSNPGLAGRVTPDGAWYVFVEATSGNLAVRNLQSGAVKLLTTDAQGTERVKAHATFPIPSRYGKKIAYILGPD
jgi:tetratricopeptide (TPR) repeat protein